MTYDILGDNFMIQHFFQPDIHTDDAVTMCHSHNRHILVTLNNAEPEARVAATEASRSCLWMSMDLI